MQQEDEGTGSTRLSPTFACDWDLDMAKECGGGGFPCPDEFGLLSRSRVWDFEYE